MLLFSAFFMQVPQDFYVVFILADKLKLTLLRVSFSTDRISSPYSIGPVIHIYCINHCKLSLEAKSYEMNLWKF